MMRLARGANWVGLAANGLSAAPCASAARRPESRSNEARPSMPRPVPIWWSICRRVSRRGKMLKGIHSLINKDSFVRHQQHLGELFPGSQAVLRRLFRFGLVDKSGARNGLSPRGMAAKHSAEQSVNSLTRIDGRRLWRLSG